MAGVYSINIDNNGLDSQYAEGFLVHLPSGIHSRMAIDVKV